MKKHIMILFPVCTLFISANGIEPILITPGNSYSANSEQTGSHMFFPFPLRLENSYLTLSYKSESSCYLELSGRGDHSEIITLPPRGTDQDSLVVERDTDFSLSSLFLRDTQGNPVSFQLKLTPKELYDSPWPRADQKEILGGSPLKEKNYHLYSWIGLEDILVFDFRNYDIQDRYFKRLAFFMEKPGFRGTLMTNEEMEGLHGWNAHDYSSWGLASFFNLARKEKFRLNREEEEFLGILLEKGILLYDGDSYYEGKGAVISITQETGITLRQRFFTHEILHGIFFSHEDFRNDIRVYWEKLLPSYRKLWRIFMVYNFYDPTDEVLMYNELLGFTLQLEREQVSSYFLWRFNRIIELHPYEKETIEPILKDIPLVMLQIYQDLEEIVSRRYPYRNGLFLDN